MEERLCFMTHHDAVDEWREGCAVVHQRVGRRKDEMDETTTRLILCVQRETTSEFMSDWTSLAEGSNVNTVNMPQSTLCIRDRPSSRRAARALCTVQASVFSKWLFPQLGWTMAPKARASAG